MPGDTSSQSVAERLRKLAEVQRVSRDRYEELHAAIRRCHPETISTRAWIKVRSALLELFSEAQASAEAQAKLFDKLARESDERRHSRRGD